MINLNIFRSEDYLGLFRWALNAQCNPHCPYKRKTKGVYTEMHREDNMAIKIGQLCGHKQRNSGNHQKLEEVEINCPLQILEGVQPWNHLEFDPVILISDLRLPESVVLSHQENNTLG